MADSKKMRRPVGNFFVKKSLQMRLIMKIVISALVSSIVSSGSLFLVYYLRYKVVVVYMWNQENNELQNEHLLKLVLPALVISAVVGVIVAIGIGLYASRKYAVPIFKIEQWAGLLLKGKMSAVLRFREFDEMKELTLKCNELGGLMRNTLLDIKNKAKALKSAGVENQEVDDILAKLERMELSDDSQPVEVHTGGWEQVPVAKN